MGVGAIQRLRNVGMLSALSRSIGCLLLIVIALLVALPVQAGTGGTFSLPLPGKKIKHRARMWVESNWVAGAGYRPVKVTIFNHPGGATTFDRDFRVVVRPSGYTGFDIAGAVQQYVEMPEGSVSGSVVISVPQASQWSLLSIEVYEGGDKIPELSEHLSFMNLGRGLTMGAWAEGMPSVLFIDPDVPARGNRDSIVATQRSGTPIPPTYLLPDIRHWQELAPPITYGSTIPQMVLNKFDQRQADSATLTNVQDNELIEMLPPDELPETWLDLTCLDIVFISLPDAEALAKNHPRRWRALLDWTASGTTLIISDVGQDLVRLEQVEKLCALSPLKPLPEEASEHRGWTLPKAEYARKGLRALYEQHSQNQRQYYNEDGTTRSYELPKIDDVNASDPRFAFRALGSGRVAAMASEESLGNPPTDLAWLLNQIDARYWIAFQRRGISLERENSDFMNFLVSGTGRVPVVSFLVLISLFSIVIGPLNYMFLKRRRRLFFLLVTVPGGAAIVTFSLFAYALVSDGLGVRLRARSFTKLDQTNGQVAVWSRQSYYAGLSPSGGLTFPTDTSVIPISEFPTTGNSQRLLVWDETQNMRNGYVPSRSSTQFLVQRVAKTEAKLEVTSAPAGSAPRVTNKLQSQIHRLVLRDRNGEYYHAGDIAQDAAVTLSPMIPSEASKLSEEESLTAWNTEMTRVMQAFSQVYNNTRPVPPDSYQYNEYSGNLWNFNENGSHYNRYYGGRYYDRSLPPALFGTSILETELRRCTMPSLRLDPGTYVVLLTANPEMPRGYQEVAEEPGMHLLEGRW